MFRICSIFASRAFRPLSVGVAVFAAALLVFTGCATVGEGPDGDNEGLDMDVLPSSESLPTIHAAAEATRAAASAEAAGASSVEASSGAPAEVASAAALYESAAPSPVEPYSQPRPSREALAALAAEGNSSNDSEIFTNDESKSRGNKFEPIIGQGYRLKLIVRVGDRDEVGPMDVMVSERGDISLPIVGRVQCDGLTINALHSRLSGIYADYFTDPDVEVMFAYSEDGISPYGQVLVQGRVAHEGWVNIPPTRNLRLSHAIQRSGGFASSALRRKVLVLRRSADGNLDRHVIDFKAIGKNGELDNDILLEPNDVIYVDESNF